MKTIEASLLAFSKYTFKFLFQLWELKKNKILNIHYDVMDNKFVNNTAFFGEKLKFLLKNKFVVSVHLMVMDVSAFVDIFLEYKIQYLTFHCEAIDMNTSMQTIAKIKNSGVKAGIAIKPNTNIQDYKKLLSICDIVTVMGVEPGYGGQKYIESTTSKLKEIKSMIHKDCLIQLDGGVNMDIINKTKEYVNFYVSGSFLMASKEKNKIKKYVEC